MKNVHRTLTVNGEEHEVSFPPHATLLEVLRENLALAGTKHGCELGECGACAVLVDDRPVLSCLVLGVECEGRSITTIEGVAANTAELHPLQAAIADLGGAQCGYCTPAMVLTAKALLDEVPDPTREQVAEALSGNLCRCTGYLQIFEAVERAAAELRAARASRAVGAVGAAGAVRAAGAAGAAGVAGAGGAAGVAGAGGAADAGEATP
jgi:carbon-monoxide dehydrogenase small subunit